jgi:hypothetical protein
MNFNSGNDKTYLFSGSPDRWSSGCGIGSSALNASKDGGGDNSLGSADMKKDTSRFDFNFDAFKSPLVPSESETKEEDPWNFSFFNKEKKSNKNTASEELAEPEPEPKPVPEPVSEPPPVDPFAGLSKSQKKKLEKKMKHEAEAKAIEDACLQAETNKAAELKQIEEEVELRQTEEEETKRQRAEDETAATVTAASAEAEEGKQEESMWDWGATTKTRRKKKKRGAKEESLPPPEPELEPEPVIEPEPVPEPSSIEEEDPWAVPVTKSKKKKKKGSREEPAPPPPEFEVISDPEPEPVGDDWDNWGSTAVVKKNKGKRDEALDPIPILEHSLLSDSVPELSSSPETEKSKKDKEQESTDRGLGSIWGGRLKKKKNSASTDVDEPGTIQEPDAVKELNLKNDGVDWAALTWGKRKGFTPDISVEVIEESTYPMQSSVKAAAEICPNRHEHLFDGKGWRACRICRAWLSQVTTELTRTGLVEDDCYGIVQ